MIELACDCGHIDSTPESSAGGLWSCPKCGRSVQLACAEELPENAGQGDFDASFIIVDGPDRVGQKILLGGVAAIEIGKLQGKHILLTGNRVSRNHCKLNRVDFGPSRWEVEDTGSTNGTFINEQKIAKQELSSGDTLQVGEFQLLFGVAEPVAEAVIDLPAAEAAPPPAPAFVPPPAPSAARHPQAAVRGSTIAYASPPPELAQRPLTECDLNWVMKLRNGARLMAAAAAPVIPAMLCFSGILIIAAPFSAILAGVSAWFLTAKEPDVRENPFWTLVRICLRLVSTASALAIPCLLAGMFADMPALVVGGAAMLLAVPVHMFLFIFYLRKLAARLPNQAMAISCIIVMVALPTSLGMIMWGAISEAMNATAQAGGGGPEMPAAAGAGFWIMGLSLWAYISILFWFNRSFS